MPPGFDFPPFPHVDLYMPLGIDPATAPIDGRNYKTIARLRPGVTLRQDNGPLTATSDATGAYVFGVDPGWSGNIVPSLDPLIFAPAARNYSNDGDRYPRPRRSSAAR